MKKKVLEIIRCKKCHMLLGFGLVAEAAFLGPRLVTGGWLGYRFHSAGHKIVPMEFYITKGVEVNDYKTKKWILPDKNDLEVK